jgi:hypothetical protein
MGSTQKGPTLLDQWFFVQKVVSDRRLSRCAVACAFHLVDYYNDRLGRAWPSYPKSPWVFPTRAPVH